MTVELRDLAEGQPTEQVVVNPIRTKDARGRDILEAIAEDVGRRPVPVDQLASFAIWEEGRRRLDGMAIGRKWDLDREERDWKRKSGQELKRIYSIALRRKHGGYRERRRRYYRAHTARTARQGPTVRRFDSPPDCRPGLAGAKGTYSSP